jgi:hypothetical protein
VGCWRIMGKDGPETRTMGCFRASEWLVGGVSGGSLKTHFSMIGLFVVFWPWFRATVAH